MNIRRAAVPALVLITGSLLAGCGDTEEAEMDAEVPEVELEE